MSIRTHGIKALGLFVLVAVCLMAITAVGASATAGKFLVNGSTSLNATVSGEVDLLMGLSVSAISLEIDCAKFKVLNGTLTASTGHGLAEILQEACNAYAYEVKEEKIINLQEEKACEIYESALDRTKKVNEGNILFKALLLVLLHKNAKGEEETIIKAEPKEGTSAFTKIFYSNCLIATVEIDGAADLSLHLGGDQVKHLVKGVNVGLSQLQYGAHNMSLGGSMWVFLTGAHTGMSWGVV